MPVLKYHYSLGRRKSSTSTVRLTKGKGVITVNDKPINEYFSNSKYLLDKVSRPFEVLELINKFDVSAKVKGGGQHSQVDSITLAIAKTLAIINEDYKPTLKKADLLGRDPREKERKKFGLKGARKKRQFTKR
ncbi:MAG TPA: 30S ribosomal protein S9 [Candidatus Saccharimonadia bacterium]|nr:30S ribosomal protein S9 [Candidatus Saccharimonadia bacterium]